MISGPRLISSDHNRENNKGHAGKPDSTGNLSVVECNDFVRRRTAQALQDISEHAHKPFRKRQDSCRINHHQQADIEKWTRKKEYGGNMMQHHAAILSLARQEDCPETPRHEEDPRGGYIPYKVGSKTGLVNSIRDQP